MSLIQSHGLAKSAGKAEKLVEDHLAVQSLIRAYQVSAFIYLQSHRASVAS